MSTKRYWALALTMIIVTFVIVACSDFSEDPDKIRSALIGTWRHENEPCEAIFYENDMVQFTNSEASILYEFRLVNDRENGVLLRLTRTDVTDDFHDVHFGVGEDSLTLIPPREPDSKFQGFSEGCSTLKRFVE